MRRFGIEPGLDRIRAALQREGRPQKSFDVISVAGTNGKGTVGSLAAALLQAQGRRVGLYTSPHLIDVTERFRVNGVPLSRAQVGPHIDRLLQLYHDEPLAGTGPGPKLTFFEMTTLMAAVLFEAEAVDCAVFEVGLGGRLDAVNAIDADVAVVTTIGRDHTEYLGESIEEIAGEKAGIFRRHAPAVLGIQEFEGARQTLDDAAHRCGATVIDTAQEACPWEVNSLEGRHRWTALNAVEALQGKPVRESVREEGFSRWRWPGRDDRLRRSSGKGMWLVDAAHNPAGVAALAKRLKQGSKGLAGIVWGGMKDKDADGVERLFEEQNVPVWGALVENERARDRNQLSRHVPRRLWRRAGRTSKLVVELEEEVDGDILVFGSVFLVGEFFEAMGKSPGELVTYRTG